MQNHFDESTLIGGPRKNVFYCNIVLEMFDVEVKHSFCTVDFFFFFSVRIFNFRPEARCRSHTVPGPQS